jgi:hypothetical protein
MISTKDVLQSMKDELAWALEGSAARWGEPYVLWSVVPDWGEFHTVRLESRDSIAVCVESEVFFEDTLDRVETQGWIQSLDPRYVAFRLIDRGTSVRKSVILVREDQVPSDRELFSLPFMVRCDNDAMRLRSRAAGITFTGGRSTQEDPRRKPDRRQAETVR